MDEDNGHVTYKHQFSEVCDVFVEYKKEARNTVLLNDLSTYIYDNGSFDEYDESLIFTVSRMSKHRNDQTDDYC